MELHGGGVSMSRSFKDFFFSNFYPGWEIPQHVWVQLTLQDWLVRFVQEGNEEDLYFWGLKGWRCEWNIIIKEFNLHSWDRELQQ